MSPADRSGAPKPIPLPLGCITLALTLALAGLACVAASVALSGCGRGGAPRRIVEREETSGRAHVRLKSELIPARGTLGDPIAWRLTATLGADARAAGVIVEKPPETLEMGLPRANAKARGAPAREWSREYQLRGFDIGAIPLPRVALAVIAAGGSDTLEFPRDTLFVDSLTQAAGGALRPDRGAIQTPLRPVDYAVIAAVALLAAAVIAHLIRLALRARRRKDTAEAPPPPEPPESILERALDALEREVAVLPRDRFYERLAQILRTYAAAATGVSAQDLTTTELEIELKRRGRVSAEGRERLIEALRRADLAKFGRFEDEESQARSIVRQARSVSGKL